MYITTYLYFICTDVTIAIIILLWVAPDFRITFENMQILSKLLNMLNGRKFEPRHEKHNVQCCFRTGPTQTELYKHRGRLEDGKF